MKNLFYTSLLLISISCIHREKFSIEIDYPEICSSRTCELELTLEVNGKRYFKDRKKISKNHEIKFPHNQKIIGSRLHLNIYIEGDLRFSSFSVLGRKNIVIPLPVNGSKVVGKLSYKRFSHSQIFHPSGNIVIVGGLKTIKGYSFSKEDDFERSIEIYNTNIHKLTLFSQKLKFGKAKPKLKLLEDARIIVLPSNEESFPEIIDIYKGKIEIVSKRGKNFLYLGENILLFEREGFLKTYDIKKKLILNEFKIENQNHEVRTAVNIIEKIYFIGTNSSSFDLKSLNYVPVKENIFEPLEEALYTFTKVNDNLFFINTSEETDTIYKLFPEKNEILNSDLFFNQSTKGLSFDSIGEYLVLIGKNFELINIYNNKRVNYKLKESKTYQSALRFNINQYFISGGINDDGVISNLIEIFLFKGGSE